MFEQNKYEKRLREAEGLLRSRSFRAAEKIYVELQEEQLQDYRAWWGQICAVTCNFDERIWEKCNGYRLNHILETVEACYDHVKVEASPEELVSVMNIYADYVTKLEKYTADYMARYEGEYEEAEAALQAVEANYQLENKKIETQLAELGRERGIWLVYLIWIGCIGFGLLVAWTAFQETGVSGLIVGAVGIGIFALIAKILSAIVCWIVALGDKGRNKKSDKLRQKQSALLTQYHTDKQKYAGKVIELRRKLYEDDFRTYY